MFVDKKVTNYENFKNHSFITKFLHENKFFLIKKILKNNFNNTDFNVLDIGSGLCEFYRTFNSQFKFNYLGVEINEKFYNICKDKLSNNNNFQILLGDIEKILPKINSSDLIILLDVLEHIEFSKRERVLKLISQIKFKKIFINVPNEMGPAIFIKNIGSRLINYKRDFEYTFIETLYATLYLSKKLPPHTNMHKNFNWRVLKKQLEKHFKVEVKTNLFNFLPKDLSPTISFICTKKLNF